MNWRTEADTLAKALESVRLDTRGPSRRAVESALERYRQSVRAQRIAADTSRQTSLLPANDPPPSRPYVQQDTSLEAADAYDKATAERMRSKVLAAIASHPATDQELAHRLSVPENSIRPRRTELRDRGLVVDTGERRKTKAGRNAIVWGLWAEGRS